MNRGLTITGAVMTGVAVLVPLLFFATLDGGIDAFFGALVFFFVILPVLGIVGLVGLILLLIGLASSDGGQQQQQQVVITSGAMAMCPNGHEAQHGVAYCTSCGVPMHA